MLGSAYFYFGIFHSMEVEAGRVEAIVIKDMSRLGDIALGRLPDARYAALDAQYAKEQDALSSEIAGLETAIGGYEQSRKSAERFISLIDKYENFDTMTNTMLNEFVEKILVHERDRKGSIETTQEVEIHFNFVGRYVPPHFREVNRPQRNRRPYTRKRNARTGCARTIYGARQTASSENTRTG